jgi:hypothetical protein
VNLIQIEDGHLLRLLHRVVCWKFIDVSEVPAASILIAVMMGGGEPLK